ncbi:MAG: hypothetical protein WDN00_03455 [Limisphaerales bacterium]
MKETLNIFIGLESRLGLVADVRNPSAAERENLWNESVETYDAAILDGHKAGNIKREIAAHLWQYIPALGKSQGAIFRQLYRKIEIVTNGGNLADKRREAAQGKRAPLLLKEDRSVLIQKAVFECGGLIDFAWQICLQKNLLSEAVLKRYSPSKNRWPRCPQNIRSQIQPEVNALYQHQVRPHFNSNNVAPMTRDWSNVFAQDIYECDDKTLDVLCRVTVEEKGEPVEREIRCQFLPMVDVKSGKILF